MHSKTLYLSILLFFLFAFYSLPASAGESKTELYKVVSAVDDQFALDLKKCTEKELQTNELQIFHQMKTSKNQQWEFRKISSKKEEYYISSPLVPGKFLADDDGTLCFQKKNKRAKWRLIHFGDEVIISSKEYGHCLSLSETFVYDGLTVILSEKPQKESSKWILKKEEPSDRDKVMDTDFANDYGSYGKLRETNAKIKIEEKEELISMDDIRSIISVENHELIVLEEGLEKYAEKCEETYNRIADPLYFRTTSGRDITVSGLEMGYKINTEKLKKDLQHKLLSKEWESPLEIEWSEHIDQYNDVGDYVEVDLSNQHVYLYSLGTLIADSDCVSGTLGTGRETPAGLYAIYYKQSPAVLRGQGYESPVTFWMPFNGGIGLHDASWRGSFGGNIYTYDGSHGCINLPYSMAETIYNTVYEGYPVMCYY